MLGNPVRVVYTDEGCSCGRTHSYDVKVPIPAKDEENLKEYVYRLEAPSNKESCNTYQYDFKAQFPVVKEIKENLKEYSTKVDRIAISKPDCV